MTTILKVTTENINNFIIDELTNIQRKDSQEVKIIIVADNPRLIFNLIADNINCGYYSSYKYKNTCMEYDNLYIEITTPNKMNYAGKEYDCAFVLGVIPVEDQLYLLSRVRGTSQFSRRFYVLNEFN